MYKIAYDATRKSLCSPGDAVSFFQFGSALTASDDALCAAMVSHIFSFTPNRFFKLGHALGIKFPIHALQPPFIFNSKGE